MRKGEAVVTTSSCSSDVVAKFIADWTGLKWTELDWTCNNVYSSYRPIVRAVYDQLVLGEQCCSNQMA